MNISSNIKFLCKKLDLSQKDLAKISNLSISTINNVFQDGADPRASTLEKIAKGLNISVDLLFLSLEENSIEDEDYEYSILLKELVKSTGINSRKHLEKIKIDILNDKIQELKR